MTFAQRMHLSSRFINDNRVIFKIIARMTILSVLRNACQQKQRHIASGAIHAKGGDAKEGREPVGHVLRFSFEEGEKAKQLTTRNDVVVGSKNKRRTKIFMTKFFYSVETILDASVSRVARYLLSRLDFA